MKAKEPRRLPPIKAYECPSWAVRAKPLIQEPIGTDTIQCGCNSLLTIALEARLLSWLEKRTNATLTELGVKCQRPTFTIIV